MTTASIPSIADADVAELESLLRDLLVEHEQLLSLTLLHRQAVSRADAQTLGACIQQQNTIIQRIAELEKRRLSVVARLVDRIPAQLGTPAEPRAPHDRPTVSWIARSLPEPFRTRLTAAADALRDLLQRLQKEHAALREATVSLASHMEGLIRQVAGKLSHTGAYGRRGIVESNVQVISALDLRS